MRFRSLLLLCLVFGGSAKQAFAVRPMEHYQNLVAGQGEAGFRDGSFTEALFNKPTGLAMSSDKSLLYVADQLNNRVRVIYLNENNRVETLAGSGNPGKQDGALEQASFNGPSALTLLPGDLLAVNDQGNSLLRLIDLKKKTVSTLAGTGNDGGIPEGNPLQISFFRVWNMVYLPKDNSLYFSQPDFKLLRKLDLKTNQVSLVLNNDKTIPQPQALCLFKDQLCVADRVQPSIESVSEQVDNAQKTSYQFNPIGSAASVLAMTQGEDFLYVAASGNTPVARANPYEPVDLFSVWGFFLKNNMTMVDPFLSFKPEEAPGFIADSREPKKFFLASTGLQSIISFKDYDYQSLKEARSANQDGLSDFLYPHEKPAGTFRIMVIGDSQPITSHESDGRGWGWEYNRVQTFPKKLELYLESEGALDNVPSHFQVLTLAQPQWEDQPIYLWPYYRAPDLVQKFDVDEVLFFVTARTIDNYSSFFWPPTPQGIPSYPLDPEWLLKPWAQRIPTGGILKKFYDRALSLKLLHLDPDGRKVDYEMNGHFVADPELRQDILELAGKPIKMLAEKVSAMKTSDGKPIRFLICFSPGGNPQEGKEEDFRIFWSELAKQNGIPFMDLTDDWFALKTTFFPTNESCCWEHYDSYGHSLLGYILAHEMIQQKWVPFEIPKEKNP